MVSTDGSQRGAVAKGGHNSHGRGRKPSHEHEQVADYDNEKADSGTKNSNPSNFATRHKEKVREIASKDGKATRST